MMGSMKRGVIVGVVVGVLLVGGVGAAVAVSAAGGADAPGAVAPTTEPDDTVVESPDPMTSEPDEALPAGAYVDYSEEALAAAEGTRVLFFHAPWCPQCRALEEDILAAELPDGVTILKVDYDSNQALRQQYGVTLQTTLVALDADGEASATFVAYDDPTLSSSLTGLGLAT
jgi:thiol-disulfide isomerase/thioredoxin